MSSNNGGNSTTTFTRRNTRTKTHKSFNIHMSIEIINKFEEKTNNILHFEKTETTTTTYDKGHRKNNFSFYESKKTPNKNINDISKKSNIKKSKITNDELKHVTFGVNDGNSNINKTFKKMKTNYVFKAPNINDFEKLMNKEHNIQKPQEIKGRLLTEPPKYEKTTIKDFKKQNSKEIDDGWNADQFGGYKKKTLDVNNRRNKNNQNKILNELNSQFASSSYIKSAQSTSVAGKGENGLKKTNQDSYISEKKINGVLNFNLFGVLDGHGVNGHHASQFVKKYIVNRIKNHPLLKNLENPKDIYHQLKANGYQIISNIYIDADNEIRKEKFNVDNSGTTCVLVFQLEENIICANAGDSRAILIFDEKNNENLNYTKVFQLSYDCKPENPSERQRINNSGGSVEQVEDEFGPREGPYRVWIKGQDYPGLAVSRSIGDSDAKKIGVIPNPQIVEYTIKPQSKYMIICSDGIWEFITNEEAMNIGNKFYLKNDALGLCNELTKLSTDIWKKEESVIDDITCVVVFF